MKSATTRKYPGLVVGLLAHVIRDAARPPLVQPTLDLLDEPGGLVLTVGQREPGHEVGALGERHLALLGDQEGVVARLGGVGEQRAHLRRALQVVAVAVEAETVGLVEPRTGLDAQERIVGLRVLLVRVVQVVGAQQRDAEVLRDGQERRPGLLLDRQAVIHDLGVEVLLAEDVLEVRRRLAGAVLLAGAQPHVDLARGAAGRGDEALAVALQQVAVEPRLAVLALEAGQRGDPEEVVHALRRPGQQRHVRVGSLAAVVPAVALLVEELVAEVERRTVEPRAGRVVALHADDRLDAGLRGLLVEVVGTEDVAVVGHRQSRHARGGGGRRHLGQLGRAVQHRVLGVDVQVHERIGGGAHGRSVLLSGRACPADGKSGGRPAGKTRSGGSILALPEVYSEGLTGRVFSHADRSVTSAPSAR
jgi:hypothetical protein